MNTRPITVAWVVPTREPVDLDTRRVDLGEPVKWRDTYVAKACLWALDGSEDDLKAAHAFAAKPDHAYPTEAVQWDRDFPDLLQRARTHALEALVPKPEPMQQKPAPKRKKT